MNLSDFLTVVVELSGLLLAAIALKRELIRLKLLQLQALDASRKLESCVCRDPSSRTRSTD